LKIKYIDFVSEIIKQSGDLLKAKANLSGLNLGASQNKNPRTSRGFFEGTIRDRWGLKKELLHQRIST
jgi:hypothetical protein